MHPFSTSEKIRKSYGFQGIEKGCIGNERINFNLYYFDSKGLKSIQINWFK